MQWKMDVLEEGSVRMGRIGIRGRRKWGLGREREEGEIVMGEEGCGGRGMRGKRDAGYKRETREEGCGGR